MRVMKALILAAVVLSGKLDDVRITEASAVPAGTGSTDQAENFVCR